MNKEIFIHSFEKVLPEFHLSQSLINEWIIKSHKQCDPEGFNEDLKRFCLSEKYISKRYFECCLDDYSHEACIEERNYYFANKAKRVFEKLYSEHIPDHLIHVTCTGYLSPSPPQRHFDRGRSPGITHAYHMGCYASIPSVRMAYGLKLSEGTDVDIVHTEMCSLHLNPRLHSPEQLVVQSLFSDGHMKYSVGTKGKGFKILSILEKIVPDSGNDMTWVPGSHGMKMTLSKEVPFKIRDSLPGFIDELCEKAQVKKDTLLHNGIFAIHPGGPKIIESVQKKLELRDEQVRLSQKVLFERGNMSSATLPHVWEEILLSRPEQGTKVLSLAFGPGLTIFGSLFEVSL